MIGLRKACILFVLGVVLTATIASGQVATGNISGRVADTTGAVISGAMIQVEDTETGQVRNVQTDETGHYEARNLSPGPYSITAQQTGFKTEVRSGITLAVGADAVVNLELSVGSVQQTVTVTSEATAVETTNATVSGLVAEQQIRDLPLNGRSVDQLSILTPGVQQIPTPTSALGGGGTQISVDGERSTSNLYLIDGTTVNSHNDAGPGSALAVQLGVDSILEFRVLTHSYSAEYGHSSGGVVSYVTRSGTNEFHGSLFEFLRNNDLDARNYFNVNGSGAPTALPPFRQNQFGASFGGPVRKNRIFFFANYEGIRKAQGVTTTAFVPDNAARNGTFAPINPIMIPYINIYPIANGADLGTGIAKFVINLSNVGAEDYVMGRTDFILSDKDTLYARYIYDASTRVNPTAIKPFASGETGTDDLAVLSETHIFSPAKLNVLTLAWNRTAPDATIEVPSALAFAPALDFNPGQGFGSISFNGSAGVTGYGSVGFGFQYFPQNTIQLLDTFTLTHGRHTLKFGGDVERYQLETDSLPFLQGQYTFTSLKNFLAGKPSQLQFSLPPGPNSVSSAFRFWRQALFGAFVQDEFRLSKNVTLNFGIREEFVTTPNEINGRSANLHPLTAAASTIGPPWESKHKLQPAPRVGFAWDPFGHGTTSVRLGAGLFYNENLGRLWYLESAPEYQFLQEFIVKPTAPAFVPNFPNALQSGYATGAVSSISETTMPFKPPTQRTTQYNLGIQHQLTPTISVEAGFVGSYSWDLQMRESADLRIPTIEPNGTDFFAPNAPFTNLNFSAIDTLRYSGIANYNALQLAVNKRLSHGLLLQVNYTFSKDLATEDDVVSADFVMNPYQGQRDYGLSNLNQKQLFRVDGRYVLPFGDLVNHRWAKQIVGGWEINGIFTAASGNPVNIQSGSNVSNDGDPNFTDRPNLVPGFSSNPTSGTTGAGCAGVAAGQKLGTPTLWYNPCAFALPTAGFFGNLGRDTVIGPGVVTLNTTLARTFSLTERLKLQLRGEFYNVTNHTNFSNPSNSVFSSSGKPSPTAGIITATAIPNRQTQIGLRLLF